MRKMAWRLFYGVSVISLALSSLWILLCFWFVIHQGGTYSVSHDGVSICGIPIFTRENWLWVGLQFFGAPLLIVVAALRSIGMCRRVLRAETF
jgi:hypothetical protein